VIYLDTSALIKRFVDEVGSPLVSTLVADRGPVATSKVAYAEVFAALARRKREGHLRQRQYAVACSQFESEWRAYLRIDVTDEVLVRARDLTRKHPLRGFDAIHVASALELKVALSEEVTFSGADQRQLDAAAAEALRVLHVETAAAG